MSANRVTVAAEVLVGLLSVQDVEGGHQDRVGDGDGGLGGAAASAKASVLGGQVGIAGAGGGLCGLGEMGAKPLGSLAGGAGAAFAGGLVVGQRPAQLARCLAVGNMVMSIPISATIVSAVRR